MKLRCMFECTSCNVFVHDPTLITKLSKITYTDNLPMKTLAARWWQTHAHTSTRTCTCTRMRTHTYTHARARAHTHTHTVIRIYLNEGPPGKGSSFRVNIITIVHWTHLTITFVSRWRCKQGLRAWTPLWMHPGAYLSCFLVAQKPPLVVRFSMILRMI